MSSAAVRRGFFEEIVGVDAFREGKAESISGVQVLGRYRLRVRLDAQGGRLRRSPDDAVLLSDLAGDADQPARASMTRRDRGRTTSRNASRSGASSWSGIPTTAGDRTANPDRIVWTIEPDAAERIRATEQNENDFTPVFNYPDAVVRDLEDKYGINRPRRSVPPPARRSRTSSSRSTPGRRAFKGAGQAPLRKAINYALDRPALDRSHGYLTATTHRSPAPGGCSARAAALSDRRAGSRHGAEVARARAARRPTDAHPLHPRASRSASRTPRCSSPT